MRLIGLLAVAVGGVLAADFRGAATTIHNRPSWRVLVREPVWFWRAWGAFMAICDLMMLIAPDGP